MTEKHNTVLNPRIPATVEAVIHDPERMWPMPAIGSRIRISGRNASLTVPLASGVIDVQASRQLLDLVFKLCDGTRTLAQAVIGIPDLHLKTQFTDFVRFLLTEGALTDASLITAKANLFAFQRNPYGRGSPAKLTDTVASRFLWNGEEAALPVGAAELESVPLDAFFSSRMTSKTFDDNPASSFTLHNLLWSLAGVLSTEHPHGGYLVPQRTIASVGLELRVAASLAGYIRTIRSPKQVQSAAHHFEIYGLKLYCRRAAALLFPLLQVIQASWPERLPPVTLGSVIGKLTGQGLQPLAVDISPDKSHIHQGRTPVTAVKALVAGLIPILFGFKQETRGMTGRINPGANFPHPITDFQPTP